MRRNYKISVAMATYNGEKYIKEQVLSIVNQLNKEDELIISDDGSIDCTLKIIKSLAKKYSQIKILEGPKKGVKANFNNAILHCSGKYIFLADQDDIWLDKKVETVLKCFENNDCVCVVHDAYVKDKKLKETLIDSFHDYRKSSSGILKNIYKNRYLGCCMAFSKQLKNEILPIPDNIEMHDQWIGIICERYGKSIFIKDKLIAYRRHDENVSSMNHYPLLKMIKNRKILIYELIKRFVKR